MTFPDTYNEIVTYANLRAFESYFFLSEEDFRFFYNGLVSGEILAVQGQPDGLVRVRSLQQTSTTALRAAPKAAGDGIESVLLTRDQIEVNYTQRKKEQ